jgi:homoserine acetyltransferase
MPQLARGLSNLARHPVLILGIQSDILFPVGEQREVAEALRMNGNSQLTYYELNSPYGHDRFVVFSPIFFCLITFRN